MNKELHTKKEIIKTLNKEYGKSNTYIVSTENLKKRSSWADNVVRKLYNGKERFEIIKNKTTGEYNFAYIKFTKDKNDNIYGIVSGKSSFHKKYPSDVCFYNIDKYYNKKKAAKRMKENSLEWYKEEILIVKNVNELDRREAFENETKIKIMFNLSS